MGTPTYSLIQEQVLGSASATVTFSSIPQTYKDLIVEFVGTTASGTGAAIRFNSDTGTNYSSTVVYGDGTVTGSNRQTNGTGIRIADPATTQNIGFAHCQSYTNTNVYKTVVARGSAVGNLVEAFAGTWRSTAAITSLDVYTGSNMQIGTTVRLWGVIG